MTALPDPCRKVWVDVAALCTACGRRAVKRDLSPKLESGEVTGEGPYSPAARINCSNSSP